MAQALQGFFSFQVAHNATPPVILCCKSREEKLEWLELIRKEQPAQQSVCFLLFQSSNISWLWPTLIQLVVNI
jgi:hypothetical protein